MGQRRVQAHVRCPVERPGDGERMGRHRGVWRRHEIHPAPELHDPPGLDPAIQLPPQVLGGALSRKDLSRTKQPIGGHSGQQHLEAHGNNMTSMSIYRYE